MTYERVTGVTYKGTNSDYVETGALGAKESLKHETRNLRTEDISRKVPIWPEKRLLKNKRNSNTCIRKGSDKCSYLHKAEYNKCAVIRSGNPNIRNAKRGAIGT